MVKKSLLSLGTSAKEKIIAFSSNMGINKSEFVELAISEYEDDIHKQIILVDSEIEDLQSQLNLLNAKKTTLTELKSREDALIASLADQKQIYMSNIKRKMDEGDVVSATEIAKRVGRLLRCSYLDLLPQ